MTNNNPFTEISQRLEAIERRLANLGTKGPEPEFVGIDQACEILNLTKSTVYKKTFENTLPHYKAGKKLMFKRSELLDIINRGRVKQTHGPRGIVVED